MAIFDTRTSAVFGQWTLPDAVLLEPDDSQPRVFYRTRTEVGVIDAPFFIRRVLRATPDVASQQHVVLPPIAYARATDTLLVFARLSSPLGFPPPAPTVILALSAADGGVRATGYSDGTWPAALIVDNLAGRVFVPRGAFNVNVQTFDLATLALI